MLSISTAGQPRTAPAPTIRTRRMRAAVTVAGVVIAMFAGGVVAAPAAAAAPAAPVANVAAVVTTSALKPARQLTFDQQLVGYVNQARANAGLHPLVVASGLARTASYWSVQMIRGTTGGLLAHNPDLRQMVLTNIKTQILTWGENVASFSGGFTARQIFNMYMASPGHRANILNPRYRYIGAVTVAGGSPSAFNTMNFAG